MSSVRGIRGATTTRENTRNAIVDATRDLLEKIVSANDLILDDIAAVIFTTTEDLNADFPAQAARQMGWEHVALLNSHEMKVPNSQTMCVRTLLLVNTEKNPQDIVNVYLRDAENLRTRGGSR
ncbi:MAG: chorismate mutase [SAR202 cluster bacterium]|jgi:chorismate mutase|nr:chorismate mutase [SAR202 cluster bacterium]